MFAAGEQSSPFTDVKEADWFYDSVQYVYENQMMSGTGDDVFTPDAATTRGMIVTILYRMEGLILPQTVTRSLQTFQPVSITQRLPHGRMKRIS